MCNMGGSGALKDSSTAVCKDGMRKSAIGGIGFPAH
jgi:hypothetical protein